MTQAVLYNSEGAEVSKVNLKKEIFGIKPKPLVVHQYVKAFLTNQRQGTVQTKTRATMSGGGTKPWRQKGTGRARAGSNTSPIWVGGGRAHGPHPRDFSVSLPRKIKLLALKSALADKASEQKIKIIEELSFETPKTKTAVSILEKLGIKENKILFLVEGKDENLYKSFRNIPKLTYKRASLANAYEILNSDYLLLTKKAWESLEEGLAR